MLHESFRVCRPHCQDLCGQYPLLLCIDCPATTWGDPDTRKCLTTCPVGTFYQAYGLTRLCVSRCYANYYADLDRICVTAQNCPQSPIMYYGDDLSNKCVQECPYNSSTFGENSTQKCVFFCSLGTFADDITGKCVAICPVGPPRQYGSNISR